MSEQGEKWTRERLNAKAQERLGLRGLGAVIAVALAELNAQSLSINALEAELEQLRPRAALAVWWREVLRRDSKDGALEQLPDEEEFCDKYDALETNGGAHP